ncbi:MAG TPA: hypothetical protein VMY35_14410 [Phycisphaerae bacterium]|nr:hypothetical protein [Phycisphaerae bacterium]
MPNVYGWIASRLKIITKAGKQEPLVPNDVQLRIYGHMAAQRAAGHPVRLIVLKARREGVSTGVEGLMFANAYHQPFKKAFVCAHDDIGSNTLFAINRLFEQELPDKERRPTEYSSRQEIIWSAPHRSQFKVATAGNTEIGRTAEIHYLHCSEVAFWKSAKKSLLSVLQAVSDDPETMIVLESTANGASGEFYERWNAAVRQQRERPGSRDGFYPVFISWLDCPEYATALDVGEKVKPLDDEERRLKALGATAEQLKWRRNTLREKCNGDEDLYKQEYPATPEDAFITSGRPAIPPKIVARHQATARPPARRVRLVRDAKGKVTAHGVGPEAQFAWEVWNEPEEHHDYAVFGDVAEGALSDPADMRSAPDFSAAAVLNRRERRIDAVWHGQTEADYFGEELLKAAQWYNEAWVSPEVNGVGMAALVPIRRANYAKLYQRVKGADRLDAGDETPLWGWKTAPANRDLMIDDWIAACREDPTTGWTEKVGVFSALLADEERTFVRKANGKREHQVGCHDDVLFAAMGVLQLHQNCPRGIRTAWAGEDEGRRPRSLLRTGGVDDFDEETEGALTTG